MHVPCDKIQLDILKSPNKCDMSYDKAQKRVNYLKIWGKKEVPV